jgi:hypothetical protein
MNCPTIEPNVTTKTKTKTTQNTRRRLFTEWDQEDQDIHDEIEAFLLTDDEDLDEYEDYQVWLSEAGGEE